MKTKSPRFFFNKAISFTFEGKVVVGLTVGTGFAAVNTGNNLLYIIFSFLISLIIVSGILSEINLKKIKVKPVKRQSLFAGSEGYISHRLTNVKKKISSYSLSVKTTVQPEVLKSQTPGYLLNLKPQSDAIVTERLIASKRGKYMISGLTITTSYPFSFFRKILKIDQDGVLFVYPEIVKISGEEINRITEGYESTETKVPGRGIEFLSTRDMREGDDARKILWKHLAKTGKMIVKEFEAPYNKEIILHVRNSSRGKGEDLGVEREISLAASLSLILIPKGYSVGLRTDSGFIEPGSGDMHLRMILEYLATLPVLGAQ